MHCYLFMWEYEQFFLYSSYSHVEATQHIFLNFCNTFELCFSPLWPYSYQKIAPIYAREETFVRKHFYNFLKFFAKVYHFPSFKNSQMLLVAISQKLILNFKMDLLKR